MEIRLKLMGMLKDRTPPGGEFTIAQDATIEAVLQALEIEVDSVHVFTVNGQLIRDKQHVLKANDELTILPPVGGG